VPFPAGNKGKALHLAGKAATVNFSHALLSTSQMANGRPAHLPHFVWQQEKTSLVDQDGGL
jgi:hypothetical protein